VDEGIVYETMGLLVDLMPYMRSASVVGVECDGGFAFLVGRIEKLLGSVVMTVRSRMGSRRDARDTVVSRAFGNGAGGG